MSCQLHGLTSKGGSHQWWQPFQGNSESQTIGWERGQCVICCPNPLQSWPSFISWINVPAWFCGGTFVGRRAVGTRYVMVSWLPVAMTPAPHMRLLGNKETMEIIPSLAAEGYRACFFSQSRGTREKETLTDLKRREDSTRSIPGMAADPGASDWHRWLVLVSDTGYVFRGREPKLSKWDLLIRNIWKPVRKEVSLWLAGPAGMQAGLSLWAWVVEVDSGLGCVLSHVPSVYILKNMWTLPRKND